jgi:serine phosphatase RsbU (regulator of sigma subunit)
MTFDQPKKLENAKNVAGSARDVVDAIFNAADEFGASAEVFDDQTVVVLKVK